MENLLQKLILAEGPGKGLLLHHGRAHRLQYDVPGGPRGRRPVDQQALTDRAQVPAKRLLAHAVFG